MLGTAVSDTDVCVPRDADTVGASDQGLEQVGQTLTSCKRQMLTKPSLKVVHWCPEGNLADTC